MPALRGKAREAVRASPRNDRRLEPAPAPRRANAQSDAPAFAPVTVFKRLQQHIADARQVVNVLMAVGEGGRAPNCALVKRQLPVHLPPELGPVKLPGLSAQDQGG